MKPVRVKFVGFWPDFDPEQFFITKILQKYYSVEITDDADYIFYSVWGLLDHLGNDKIRIFFSGENFTPDFNLIDYGISVYPISFLDRHFSCPGLVLPSYDFLSELSNKDRNYPDSILDNKPYFANFIASHESEDGIRGDLFRLLSNYKRVESPGTYLNNMPNNERVDYKDGTKQLFQKQCKFTLCSESLVHEGFVTEKIFDALLADTIPIYYGSSTISDVINPKAFIDVRNYDSLQDVVQHIIELDKDDSQYLSMLRQPIFVQEKYVEQKLIELENFIRNIFDQPLEKASRRAKVYSPSWYERDLIAGRKLRVSQKQAFRLSKEIVEQKKSGSFFEVLKSRHQLARILLSLHQQFPFRRENQWLYELAFPKTMYLYWTAIGIANKLKRSLKQCRKLV